MRNPKSLKQMVFDGFETPFENWLDPENRWIRLSQLIPWEELSEAYNSSLSRNMGRPGKEAQLVIGAVIIKHKLCLGDEETIQQIRENPYLQSFVGFKVFHKEKAFAPSLFVEIRRRMGPEVFARFEDSIIAQISAQEESGTPPEASSDDDRQPSSEEPVDSSADEEKPEQDLAGEMSPHQGKLIVDATVCEQMIRFPTDLGLLNEARELSEAIIDALHPLTGMNKKVRTYRRNARRDYLSLVKQRRPGPKKRRRGKRQQLQYLKRNLGYIETMLDMLPGLEIPLSHKQLRQYWIIQHLYHQQKQMFDTNTRRCDDRIVSIHQPHVRPIVRGKVNKSVEFGAKLGVSLDQNGIACVDHFSWDAYHEGRDLPEQVEAYKNRHGHYPEKLLADPAYGTRENRKFLKEKGIRFAGKPLGRPPKIASADKDAERRQKQQDYRERIPIEGKFGQGKNGYQLNTIRARTAETSQAWIRSIFLVMNLLVLIRIFCVHMPECVRIHLIGRLNDKIRRLIVDIYALVPKLTYQNSVTVTF